MSVTVNIKSNVAAIKRELDVARSELLVATSSAINKVAITVRAEAAREIQKVYNIKVSAAKGRMLIRRATRAHPEAIITASGKPIALLGFAGTRQNKKGIGLQIKVQGGRKTIAHAFINTTKGGQRAAFIREGKARYPLKFLRSVGLAQTFASDAVTKALKKIVGDRFPIVYRQELKFALSKKGTLVVRP